MKTIWVRTRTRTKTSIWTTVKVVKICSLASCSKWVEQMLPREPDRHHYKLRGLRVDYVGSPTMSFALHLTLVASRLRNMLQGMQSMDPSEQYMAVQELNDVLAVSTEENLGPSSGVGFETERFVSELAKIISGENNPLGVDNPELQLMACRCISNLIEAIPTGSTFYAIIQARVIPILSAKLMAIDFIDVAEQAISTLERISREHTKEIIKEGALQSMLGIMDFFNLSVQRTVVQCAANCLMQLPRDQVANSKDIVSMLSNLLSHHDQKMVELACTAIGRCIESMERWIRRRSGPQSPTAPVEEEIQLDTVISEQVSKSTVLSYSYPQVLEKLNNLVYVSLGGANEAGIAVVSNTTVLALLRMLRILAEKSFSLRMGLLKMNQGKSFLGVVGSAASSQDHADSRTPASEYVFPILELISALLPSTAVDRQVKDGRDMLAKFKSVSNEKEEIKYTFPLDAKEEVDAVWGETITDRSLLVASCRQFLPFIIETYLNTVNMSIRMKCMISTVRIISFLNQDELSQVLAEVAFASFLSRVMSRFIPTSVSSTGDSSDSRIAVNSSKADIISSKKKTHLNVQPMAVLTYSMRMCILLMEKLPGHYNVYLRREGVMHELIRIAKLVQETSVTKDLVKLRQDYFELRNQLSDRKRQESQQMMARFNVYRGGVESNAAATAAAAAGAPKAAEVATAASTTVTTGATIRTTRSSSKRSSGIVGRGWKGKGAVERSISSTRKEEVHGKEGAKDSKGDLQGLKDIANDPEMIPTALLANSVTASLEEYQHAVDFWFAQKLSQHARDFLNKYETKSSSKDDDLEHDEHPAAQVVNRLKDLVSKFGSSDASDETILKGLAASFSAVYSGTDSYGGITVFEILNSGLIPNLLDWLICKDRDDDADVASIRRKRAQLFVNQIYSSNADGTTKIALLLKFLQDCVSRLEFFDLVTPFSPEVEMGASTKMMNASLLTKQVRLRLKPTSDCFGSQDVMDEDEDSVNPLSNLVISVHSVAELKGIEEYLLPKLEPQLLKMERRRMGRTPQATSPSATEESTSAGATRSRHASGRRRGSTDGEEKDDKADPTGRIRHDSSFVHDVEADGSMSKSKSSYATAASSAASKYGIEFSIGEMTIPKNLAVYGAIHRFESEYQARTKAGVDTKRGDVVTNAFSVGAAASDRAINVFGNLYTVTFRTYPKENGGAQSSEEQLVQLSQFESHIAPLMKPCVDSEDARNTSQANLYDDSVNDLPTSLLDIRNDDCVQALMLMRVLCLINGLVQQKQLDTPQSALPANSFHHRKLIAKVNRQLSDILVVSSALLPSWTLDLCRSFTFLFPFETRIRFVQNAYFGSNRALMRWQQQENPGGSSNNQTRQSGSILQMLMSGRNEEIANSLGRISRQKVRIGRDRIFDSALKVLDLYASNAHYMMEVEYFDEVGSGLGPTLEFYAVVSQEWQRTDLRMWRSDSLKKDEKFVHMEHGLFPLPMAAVAPEHRAGVLKRFRLLGLFVAKSMLDFRLIDIPLSLVFLQTAFFGTEVHRSLPLPMQIQTGLRLLAGVDPKLAQSLQMLLDEKDAKSMENLCLDFTLPGHPTVELVPSGSSTSVTLQNVSEYLMAVLRTSLYDGIEEQVKAFQDGFNAVFPLSSLRLLTVEEIQNLLSSGSWEGKWDRMGRFFLGR